MNLQSPDQTEIKFQGFKIFFSILQKLFFNQFQRLLIVVVPCIQQNRCKPGKNFFIVIKLNKSIVRNLEMRDRSAAGIGCGVPVNGYIAPADPPVNRFLPG